MPLLNIVLGKAKRREVLELNHQGSVKLCTQYWDYLGLVWLVLISVLYFAT